MKKKSSEIVQNNILFPGKKREILIRIADESNRESVEKNLQDEYAYSNAYYVYSEKGCDLVNLSN